MLSSVLLATITAFSALASAQNFTLPGQGNISIVPDSVPIETRYSWCNGQQQVCLDVCHNQASPRNCYPDTLEWQCECLNGPTPNISDYTNTIPYFECHQWIGDCLAYYAGNAQEQAVCQTVTCGNKNATSNIASSSAPSSPSMTSSSAGSPTHKPTKTSATAMASNSSGAAVMSLAVDYSTGILSVVLFSVFGLAL